MRHRIDLDFNGGTKVIPQQVDMRPEASVQTASLGAPLDEFFRVAQQTMDELGPIASIPFFTTAVLAPLVVAYAAPIAADFTKKKLEKRGYLK